MKFEPLAVAGSYLIEPEAHTDERGFFARTYCSREFAKNGLNEDLQQCGISFNSRKHTLRGMHYQLPPHEETKLVRCTRGAAYHVIADLREESGTYLQWSGIELNSENRKLLYVPEGVAHGFVTLADETEIFYQMSEFHMPGCEAGIRWNDPAFNIAWPLQPAVISERDSNFADFQSRT